MSLALFLPWFPILLAVGLGGRLLGRSKGYALGLMCALFWIALVHLSTGGAAWQQAGALVTLLSGSVAIITMGGWAGESGAATDQRRREPAEETGGRAEASATPLRGASALPDDLHRLTEMIERFDEWLAENEQTEDLWPAFDAYVRGALRLCCGATRVRPYRVTGDGAWLEPLRIEHAAMDRRRVSADEGLLGEVLAARVAYVGGAGRQAERAADEGGTKSEAKPAWCFPVLDGGQALGVVWVGQVELSPLRQRAMLSLAERWIAQCWRNLVDTARRRLAAMTDPTSAVHTRDSFLELAGGDVAGAYALGEPVALAVVALEGLRELNDNGRWEVADEIVRDVGAILRSRVRADDRVGRFDGSRFLVLLRRVDAELSQLIVRQLLERLARLCEGEAQRDAKVGVRLGVAVSGSEMPELRVLLARALDHCRKARLEKTSMSGDYVRAAPQVEEAAT
ncbi:MAG: diguanylate cyclase [Phycisphaerae bacterium]|nr:diguanylate cyclase [Phycisphaerae bacterium]